MSEIRGEKCLRCDCGRVVRAPNATVCRMCFSMTDKAPNALRAELRAERHKHAPKHQPTRSLVQHDPIIVAYAWRNAIWR